MTVIERVSIETIDYGVRVTFYLGDDARQLFDTSPVYQLAVQVPFLDGSTKTFGVKGYSNDVPSAYVYVSNELPAQANYENVNVTFNAEAVSAWYPDSSITDWDRSRHMTASVSAEVPHPEIAKSRAVDVQVGVPVEFIG